MYNTMIYIVSNKKHALDLKDAKVNNSDHPYPHT